MLVKQTYLIENQTRMKAFLIILMTLACFPFISVSAQSVSYSYDRSGNRIGRKSSSPNRVKTKERNVTGNAVSSDVNAVYNSISKNIDITSGDFLRTPMKNWCLFRILAGDLQLYNFERTYHYRCFFFSCRNIYSGNRVWRNETKQKNND